MNTIVSIDPGKWNLPWCVWKNGLLAHAGMSVLKEIGPTQASNLPTIAAWHFNGMRFDWPGAGGVGNVDHVYIEQLSLTVGRDRTRGKAISTGNALLELTSIAAMIAGYLHAPVKYLPVGVWKGSAKKDVTRNRVRATLTPDELAILDAALAKLPRRGSRESSLAHNLYDSCGIGLCATRRYVVRRGYAG
jgi:hypothetical protein